MTLKHHMSNVQYVLFAEHDKHANGLAVIYPLVL